METLSSLLQPYKHVIATSAEVMTTLQMFSGTIDCWNIHKKKSSEGYVEIPFLVGILMGGLQMNYGFILKDAAIFKTNLYGVLLSIAYLSVFVYYTKDSGPLWKKIKIVCGFVGAVVIYTQLEDPSLVEQRFGMIMSGVIVMLLGLMGIGVKNAIQNKSTEGLPFPMLLSGTIVGFLWLLHAIVLNNSALLFQNLLTFTLFGFQLSLFAIYPSRSEKHKSETKKVN